MPAETAETIATAELRAVIEGVYTMAAWYDSNGKAVSPEADGRWVLVDGVFVSLLLKREDDGSKIPPHRTAVSPHSHSAHDVALDSA